MAVSRSKRRLLAAVAVGACWWYFAAFAQAHGYETADRTAGVDPARAAHEVFQDSRFWWKRIEPPRPMSVSVSFSWLWSLLESPLKEIGRILGKIAQAILRFLARLFGSFGGTASDATTAVFLIVIGLLAWSSWKLYPVIARWLTAGRPERMTTGNIPCQPLAEATDLFEQAGQAFGAGRHGEAIRLALLALIARLEKRGLLRYDTTRTNREYQRDLRHRAELSASFGQLARIYDRVWYGGAPANRGDAERAIALCRTLINQEDLTAE
jgi:hypothetical protein